MSPLIGEEGLGVDYMSENGSFNLRIRDKVIISSQSAQGPQKTKKLKILEVPYD